MEQIDESGVIQKIHNVLEQIKQHFDYEEQVSLRDGLHMTNEHRAEHSRIKAYINEITPLIDMESAERVVLAVLEEVRLHILHVDTQLTKQQNPCNRSSSELPDPAPQIY